MKFKGQGKINICGFEYIKNIADSRRGGVRAPKKTPCIRAWGGGVMWDSIVGLRPSCIHGSFRKDIMDFQGRLIICIHAWPPERCEYRG